MLWVFIAVSQLSLAAASGGYSSLPCMGFSLPWRLLMGCEGSRASVVAAHGLSSCGTQAYPCYSKRSLPRPGIEPMFPALAGEFLSTGPPKKTSICFVYLASSDGGQLPLRLSRVLLNLLWMVFSKRLTRVGPSHGVSGFAPPCQFQIDWPRTSLAHCQTVQRL